MIFQNTGHTESTCDLRIPDKNIKLLNRKSDLDNDIAINSGSLHEPSISYDT